MLFRRVLASGGTMVTADDPSIKRMRTYGRQGGSRRRLRMFVVVVCIVVQTGYCSLFCEAQNWTIQTDFKVMQHPTCVRQKE